MPVRLRARRFRARAAPRPRGAVRAAGRCLDTLVAGDGEPPVATIDPREIAITGERAARSGRAPDSWEHVMHWGAPTEEQHRLLAAGHAVRVPAPVAGVRS
ncbi:hypothetical protein [Blastococcus sp. SYSU DS0541]